MPEQSFDDGRQTGSEESDAPSDIVQHNDTTKSQPLGGLGEGCDDPFANLENLRLSQDFASQVDVKPQLTTIPTRKPKRQEHIRVRSGPEWRFLCSTFTEDQTGEVHLVAPSMCEHMMGEAKPTCLVLGISRNSIVPFLWALRMAGLDGQWNPWHESAFQAAEVAKSRWVRIESDRAAGCYVPHVANSRLADPVWPVDLTMNDYLRLAFGDRLIQDVNHLVLKKLRGEA